jgi:hypothetical protein
MNGDSGSSYGIEPVRRPPSQPEIEAPVAEIDEEAESRTARVVKPKKKKKKPQATGLAAIPKSVWIGSGIGAGSVVVVLMMIWLLTPRPADIGPVGPNTNLPVVIAARPEQELSLNAGELLQKYRFDEAEADRLYRGSILRVTGYVAIIGRTGEDRMFIELKEGNKFAITTVQCYFRFKDWGDLTGVQQGDTLTVRGRCDGRIGNVILKDCRVVVAPKKAKRGSLIGD